MKRILIAIMFVVGLSGAAQAKIVYLQCGNTSTALDIKNKKMVASTHHDEIVYISEVELHLRQSKKKTISITIYRLNLDYIDSDSVGICQIGRKF